MPAKKGDTKKKQPKKTVRKISAKPDKVSVTPEKEAAVKKDIVENEESPKKKTLHDGITRVVGRRKTSIARAWLRPENGQITVNEKDIYAFFSYDLTSKQRIDSVFSAISRKPTAFSGTVKVTGGGKSGQLSATIHAIARALARIDSEFAPLLRKAGFLTRDPRMKERRKYGLRKARKAQQYSKR